MKRKFTTARHYVRSHWRLLVVSVVGVVILGLMLLFRLGSLTHGLSDVEVRQALFSSSWRHIVNNPLGIPFTAVQWLIQTLIPHHGNTVSRAASPLFGILALAAFAYVLRRWYGIRSALYGTVLFGISSWFLHVSRYAGMDVLYLWSIPSLLALCIIWDRHHANRLSVYACLAGLGVALYIPGLIWFVVAALVIQPHLLTSSWRGSRTVLAKIVLVVIPLIVITPLVIAFLRDISLLRAWLGLPDQFASVGTIFRNAVHSVSFFVYRGPATPELWLARSPILNFFTTVMALLGILFYARHFKAPRTRLLVSFFIIGAVLFALGGIVTISVLIPIVYLFVAAGFGYLLHEWLRVFPRNPLARGIGFSLLAVVVALACAYDLKAYYVAWPHNAATRSAFHERS